MSFHTQTYYTVIAVGRKYRDSNQKCSNVTGHRCRFRPPKHRNVYCQATCIPSITITTNVDRTLATGKAHKPNIQYIFTVWLYSTYFCSYITCLIPTLFREPQTSKEGEKDTFPPWNVKNGFIHCTNSAMNS
jgi:hypothetical protein